MSDNETPARGRTRGPAARSARVGGIAAVVGGILTAVGVTIVYTQENVEWSTAWIGLLIASLSVLGFVASGLLAFRGALKLAPWLVIPSLLLSAVLFLGSLASQLVGDTLGIYWFAITLYGLSVVIGLVSLIFLLIAFARRPRPVKPPTNRKCPHCAEMIKVEATVCRYCGRDISPSVMPDA